jgi:predicted FMN-binding regulatory protein PaiB
VTAPRDGLLATMLPFVYDQAVGTNGALLGHVARNNAQRETPILGDALVIIAGPDAYISPSAYASNVSTAASYRPGTMSPHTCTATSGCTTTRAGWISRSAA